MKGRLLLLVFFVCLCSGNLFGQQLLDATDRQPVPFAQLIDEKGVTIGVTDVNGQFPDSIRCKEITIQHLAYQSKTLRVSDLVAAVPIYLSPVPYELGEVTVASHQVDYIHLTTYFRSYQLNDSCLKYYRDGYADYFIRLKNKKVKRIVPQMRTLVNRHLVENDRQRANQVVDKYITIPYMEERTLIERIKENGGTYQGDSLMNPLFVDHIQVGVVKMDTAKKVFRVEYDALATRKKKSGTLFGYTTRLENYFQTEVYLFREGYQSYMDLLNRKDYRKLFYKHKDDLREQLIEVTDELYVLSHEYLTSDEAKSRMAQLKSAAEKAYPVGNGVVPSLPSCLEETLETEMAEER